MKTLYLYKEDFWYKNTNIKTTVPFCIFLLYLIQWSVLQIKGLYLTFLFLWAKSHMYTNIQQSYIYFVSELRLYWWKQKVCSVISICIDSVNVSGVGGSLCSLLRRMLSQLRFTKTIFNGIFVQVTRLWRWPRGQ